MSRNRMNINLNPFSQEAMSFIFELDPLNSNKLVRRESPQIEFKQNYNWNGRADYAKTAGAFANREGGYLIFGIQNRPKFIIGMTNDNFEEQDPADLSTYFNSSFDPEIKFDIRTHRINGLTIGIIYIFESEIKPVICKSNDRNVLHEGEIYYRYGGQSKKIGFAELHKILMEIREQESKKFANLIQRIATIGVNDVALLDKSDGSVMGSSGKTFYIDKSLLDKLKVYQEGHFSEIDGEPIFRLVGDIVPIDDAVIRPTRTRYKPIIITASDIITFFLKQYRVESPEEFIKQMAHEPSGYNPIFYYLELAKMSIKEALSLIQKSPARSAGKTKLIERLTHDENFYEPIKIFETKPSKMKVKYQKLLLEKSTIEHIPIDEVRYYCGAIRSLTINQIDVTYLFPQLLDVFYEHFPNKEFNVSTDIRKTICYLDSALFRQQSIIP